MFASTFDALREAILKPRVRPVVEAAARPRQYVLPPLVPRPGSPISLERNPGPGSRLTLGLRIPGAFLRRRRGSVAVESAIAIAILVTACGGLMAIAHAAYTDDRMNRAAGAAARAIALAPESAASEAALASAACDAIRRELDLAPEFDCADAWTITVKTNLTASALASGAVGNTHGGSGEMVLVEIGWEQAAWARAVRAMQGAGGRTAVGLARSEPVD